MNPITHFLAGWTATLPFDLERRDRAWIVFASIAPDLDSLALIGDLIQGRSADDLELWTRWHHVLGHNVGAVILLAGACLLTAGRRPLTPLLAVLAMHLHFLLDIIGARGPDGYQWPIPYLLPFSRVWQWSVPWQWPINAWPNILLTLALLAIALFWAWKRGSSPLMLFSRRADEALVGTLRGRFGQPPTGMKAEQDTHEGTDDDQGL